MEDALLKARLVAEKLDVAIATVYELAHSGKLPAVFINRGPRKALIRFRPEAVKAFIEGRESGKEA